MIKMVKMNVTCISRTSSIEKRKKNKKLVLSNISAKLEGKVSKKNIKKLEGKM